MVLTTFQTLYDISRYSSDNHIIVHHLEGSQGKGRDFLKGSVWKCLIPLLDSTEQSNLRNSLSLRGIILNNKKPQ